MHLSGYATNRKTASGGTGEEAWHGLSSDCARIIEKTFLMTEIQFSISFNLALTTTVKSQDPCLKLRLSEDCDLISCQFLGES